MGGGKSCKSLFYGIYNLYHMITYITLNVDFGIPKDRVQPFLLKLVLTIKSIHKVCQLFSVHYASEV
jgi:hypothetical protein